MKFIQVSNRVLRDPGSNLSYGQPELAMVGTSTGTEEISTHMYSACFLIAENLGPKSTKPLGNDRSSLDSKRPPVNGSVIRTSFAEVDVVETR